MSKDLNQCNFIGRLGKSIELTYTAGGSAVGKFTMAIGDDYKDKQGAKVEQTNWIRFVVFGKSAENLANFTDKGSKLFVNGKYTVRKYQDQSGSDQYSNEINVQNFQFLDKKSDSTQSQQPAQHSNQTGGIAEPPGGFNQPQNSGGGDDGFDDIPFSKVDGRYT